MPRKRKTMSGAPAQAVGAVAGQMYGAGVDQMELQRQMPAPATSGGVRITMPTPPPGATPTSAQQPPADPMAAHQAALEAAAKMKGMVGALTQPTTRPDEPVTAGLVRGPGPGPSTMEMPGGSPVGNQLRRLAELTGETFFADLARKASL